MKKTDYKTTLKKLKKKFTSTTDPKAAYKPPEKKDTYQDFCSCTDAHGCPKILYPTRKEAKKQLAYLNLKNLRIYPCPSEKGWHLTKG